MKKHTKGPWLAIKTADHIEIAPIGALTLAIVLLDDEEAQANAHLIAASPTLLEACEAALMSIELGPALGSPELAKKILQNAIDKAKGKGET